MRPASPRGGGSARLLLVVAAALVAVAALFGAAARAAPGSWFGYSMELSAVTGPAGGDLTIAVLPKPVPVVGMTLRDVRIRLFAPGGSPLGEKRIASLALPEGVAVVPVGPVERLTRVVVDARVTTTVMKTGVALRAEAVFALRPDLVVSWVHAPAQTLVGRPIDITAEIAELNGDLGAEATATLVWGPLPLAEQEFTVDAGDEVVVTFAGIALSSPVLAELTVVVHDASPAETDETNNRGSTTVDVTALELARARLLVESLGGYGAQLNQHVYAAITSAPAESLPDLEAKVKALEPQLVRIFYAEQAETTYPDRMASFVETVTLAHESGASVNITYQSTSRAKLNPPLYMRRFAVILEDLVHTRGLTNVRWVTIQNEPNSTELTLAQYEALYRALHAELVTRGLEDEIGLMGGDLLEFGDDKDQPVKGHRDWLMYMATRMNDIVDAYSEHIYWNYWDLPRMEFRLRDVRTIVTEELPPEARKPVFVTEFGVRGIRNVPGKPNIASGYWEDGTQMARTNIAAFQQLWFNVAAAQLGFAGTVKWDAYWGVYDNTYKASYWLIGPAEEGWPLMPGYHAFRLLLQTTARGWQVVGVDPWAEDDWKAGVADAREQEVAAYVGLRGELTLVGLDSNGRGLNAATTAVSAYSIGGLPASSRFTLALWNASGDGRSSVAGTVTTNAAGVARFEVPLHAAFALTTVPVS